MAQQKAKKSRKQRRNPLPQLPEPERTEWKEYLAQNMPNAEHRAHIRRFLKLPLTDEEDVIGRSVGAFFNWQDRMRAKKQRAKKPDGDKDE